MKTLITIFMFTGSFCFAQGTSPYKIVSMYHKDALVTERFLPFQILNLNNEPVSIEAITASKPCYGMVDPHRAHIALFFCTEETSSGFSLNIRDKGQLQVFKSPAFDIKKLALLSSTPNPDKPKDPDSPGKVLYTRNCASCHTSSNRMVETTTVQHLKNLFAGTVRDSGGQLINSMTMFHNFFTDPQLNDITKYINEEL